MFETTNQLCILCWLSWRKEPKQKKNCKAWKSHDCQTHKREAKNQDTHLTCGEKSLSVLQFIQYCFGLPKFISHPQFGLWHGISGYGCWDAGMVTSKASTWFLDFASTWIILQEWQVFVGKMRKSPLAIGKLLGGWPTILVNILLIMVNINGYSING